MAEGTASGLLLLLQSFSGVSTTVQSLPYLLKNGASIEADLLLLHSPLATQAQWQRFLQLRAAAPHVAIVVVSNELDTTSCLKAIEAGASDCITEDALTTFYLRKAVLRHRQMHRNEENKKQNRERLLACLQNTPNVAVQWYNGRGEVVFWNKASERLYGWSEEEATGKTVDALIVVPANRQHWLQQMQQVSKAATDVVTEEWSFARRDGSLRHCLSTLFSISSGDCEPLFVCMDVDLTERRQSEQTLQEAEKKYRSLVEQQADAIALFDKAGNILDVNNSATALLGYEKEELQRMKLDDVLLAAETIVNPVDYPLLETGASTIKQRRLRRKNGTAVETEVHAKQLFDGLFMASVRDLTERMDVQHRLQKEIELSESIINSLPGVFYLFTHEGKYLRWNRQQEAVSEYCAAEISRMSPLDFIADADKEAVQQAMEETFAAGRSAIEAGLRTKSGKIIPHYFTGNLVQYAGTDCLLGTGLDLSALKDLEKELSQQKIAEQKRVMQAMIDAEEKERHNLGLELHDNVNQILSVVRMYLSILASEEKMEEITLPKAMNLLNDAMTEIRHLSHSLAVSYKFETGLAGTLEETVENIRAAKGLNVQLSLPARLDDLTTARQKLVVYRIVQEQLNNVIKHAKATVVEVKIKLTQTELHVTVADDGKGFAPSKTKKGLGLNNITNRAEALGGKAAVHAKPGKGTRLEVVIPLEEEA